ncbi:MAG: hypothetical protein KGL04_04390, partial [Elusimicrobia bacterium]|nr:hypothetical protein [Elusimicrobiota bacterium]
MTVSARLKRAFLAAGLGATCDLGASAQGWRAEPELPETPGAPLQVLAQAEAPVWDAAKLDHFFDAAPVRPPTLLRRRPPRRQRARTHEFHGRRRFHKFARRALRYRRRAARAERRP